MTDDGKTDAEGRKPIRSYRDLEVYQLAYASAMDIFRATKTLPAEERFSLSDQIRRSSRSVCANISEGWAQRRYEAKFKNRLSDAEGSASETQTWLDFGKDCGYFKLEFHKTMSGSYDRISAMLYRLAEHWQTFTPGKSVVSRPSSVFNPQQR
ncbi:MAG: four helix bundle protein [Verrucomicrobiia bacterium]|jgi:four helix bundle protein